MKWQLAEVPVKRTRSGNIWDTMIPADLIRAMRGNPGSTFQMLDDDGQPLAVAKDDYNALMRSCPKPFRLQSRSLPNRRDGARLVWLSMDPGHWERQAKLRHKRNAA